jgi:polysaccharide pyruvyl transferase WcaK-like protein
MTSGSLKALTADILLIGGGSIFFEKSGLGTHILTVLTILRKLLFRRKFYYYGIGVSSKTSTFLRALMAISFRLADGVYVRDSLSYKVVSEEFKVKRIHLMRDLALFLRRNENLPKEILELKNKKEGPLVGFCLSTTNSGHDKQLFQNVAKFIHYLVEKQKATIWFISFYPAFGDNDESIRPDEYAAMSVMNALPPEVKSSIHNLPYFDPATTERIVGELDSVISMRYHGLVFAHKEKKPFIAISSADKHRSFVHDVGGEELDLDSATFDKLLVKWQKLVSKI